MDETSLYSKRWNKNAKLLLAIQNMDVDGAFHLFQEGVDTDTLFAINSHQISALSLAVENKDEDMVRLFLKMGVNVNPHESSGRSPLHIACEYGYYFLVKLLLEYKADARVKNKFGQTALHLAAQRGNVDICELLIEYCVSISERDYKGRTPLHYASLTQNRECVLCLLELGATSRITDHSGNTPLHFACCSFSCSSDILEMLGKNFPKAILLPNSAGKTPLHAVVNNGKYTEVENLNVLLRLAKVNLGCYPSAFSPRTEIGHTPLHLAVLERNVNAVRQLVASGAEVDTRDQLGRTPLECAVRDSDRDIIKLLLEAGASTRRLTFEGKVLSSVRDSIVRDILQKNISCPLKLSSLCRRSVSRYFGPRVIELLPYIPRKWGDLLLFKTL